MINPNKTKVLIMFITCTPRCLPASCSLVPTELFRKWERPCQARFVFICPHSNERVFHGCGSRSSHWRFKRISKDPGLWFSFPFQDFLFTSFSLPPFLTPVSLHFYFFFFTSLLRFFCKVRREILCLAFCGSSLGLASPPVAAFLGWHSPPPLQRCSSLKNVGNPRSWSMTKPLRNLGVCPSGRCSLLEALLIFRAFSAFRCLP